MLAAVAQNRIALQFEDETLKWVREFMLAAMAQNGKVLQFGGKTHFSRIALITCGPWRAMPPCGGGTRAAACCRSPTLRGENEGTRTVPAPSPCGAGRPCGGAAFLPQFSGASRPTASSVVQRSTPFLAHIIKLSWSALGIKIKREGLGIGSGPFGLLPCLGHFPPSYPQCETPWWGCIHSQAVAWELTNSQAVAWAYAWQVATYEYMSTLGSAGCVSAQYSPSRRHARVCARMRSPAQEGGRPVVVA